MLERAHAYIETVLASKVDATRGMRQLCDYCRSVYPADVWDLVAMLPITEDVRQLEHWFIDVLESEPPDNDIAAFWFGLYSTDDGYRLYLAGTKSFDPDDPTGDWAADPEYWPDKRVAPSTVLQSLPTFLVRHERAAAALGDYILTLGYACLAVTLLITRTDPLLVVGGTPSRGVAVGFDDGNFVVLGLVTAEGFVRKSS